MRGNIEMHKICKVLKFKINVDTWRVCHSSALFCVVEPQVVLYTTPL